MTLREDMAERPGYRLVAVAALALALAGACAALAVHALGPRDANEPPQRPAQAANDGEGGAGGRGGDAAPGEERDEPQGADQTGQDAQAGAAGAPAGPDVGDPNDGKDPLEGGDSAGRYAPPPSWADTYRNPEWLDSFSGLDLLGDMPWEEQAAMARAAMDVLDDAGMPMTGTPVEVVRGPEPSSLHFDGDSEVVYLSVPGRNLFIEARRLLATGKWVASELHETVAGVNDDPLRKVVGGEVAIYETDAVASLTEPDLAEGLADALGRWGAEGGTPVGYTTMQADTVRRTDDGGWAFRVYTFTALRQVPTTTFIDVSWSPDGTFAFAKVG